MENTEKKVIFSGIQPSGRLTLGNYLGAVKNWEKLQTEYNCIYCVVDMHAITTRQDPAVLRRQTMEVFAQLIACGIDPKTSVLFIQSHVPAHAELAWALNCFAMFGELTRMTQFKDKSQKNADNINAGLFTYPVLMAADILLYGSHLVPVGADQKQHVEITRDIAERFNGIYGDVFVLPEPYIPQMGARIMSLTDPQKKMSKSDENPNSYILIMDSADDILRKCRRAVTDSEARVCFAEGKDGINNLMGMYASATGNTYSEIEDEFSGLGYGDFKAKVGEAVSEMLRPVREKTEYLLKNRDYLEGVYKEGADKAAYLSSKMLSKVYKKIGFIKRAF